MIPPPNLPVALRVFQAALCLLTLVSAGATNHTIDYNSSHFVYHGSWESIKGNLDASGGHMSTNKPGAFATISYNFSSVYILSAKWPYTVSTYYTINGNKPGFTIDMRDHSVPARSGGNATLSAKVVGNWSSTMNQQRTINVTLPPGANESGMSSQFAVVDRFIFEVLDASSTISSTSHTSTTSTNKPGSITTSSTSHTSITSPNKPGPSSTISSTSHTSTTSTSKPQSSSITTSSTSHTSTTSTRKPGSSSITTSSTSHTSTTNTNTPGPSSTISSTSHTSTTSTSTKKPGSITTSSTSHTSITSPNKPGPSSTISSTSHTSTTRTSTNKPGSITTSSTSHTSITSPNKPGPSSTISSTSHTSTTSTSKPQSSSITTSSTSHTSTTSTSKPGSSSITTSSTSHTSTTSTSKPQSSYITTSSTSHTSTTSTSKPGSSYITTSSTSHTSTTSTSKPGSSYITTSSTSHTSTTSTNKPGSSPITTSTSPTSTTSASSTSSISTSSTSPVSVLGPVSNTHPVRLPVAISVGIVGTFALLFVFLLWRFCSRRQASRYHSVTGPTAGIGLNTFATSGGFSASSPIFTPGSDANAPLTDNNSGSISDDLQRPPIALNYHPVISSNNGPPSPLSPATPHHRLSTVPKATNSTMYSSIPLLDGSSAVSLSSGNRDINERSRNSSRISPSTLAGSQDESLPVSTAIPGRHEENVWDSGYPQPLKFMPII